MEYTKSQLETYLNQYVHNAKYRQIIMDKLHDGLTFEDVAERNNMSVRQCKTIVAKAKKNMSKFI